MAFPAPFQGVSSHNANHASFRCSAAASSPTTSSVYPRGRTSEGDHLLEKLEFALAVAISRGDTARVQALRDQIDALGGNCEEPGT